MSSLIEFVHMCVYMFGVFWFLRSESNKHCQQSQHWKIKYSANLHTIP